MASSNRLFYDPAMPTNAGTGSVVLDRGRSGFGRVLTLRVEEMGKNATVQLALANPMNNA